jgi:hypothetical protein
MSTAYALLIQEDGAQLPAAAKAARDKMIFTRFSGHHC